MTLAYFDCFSGISGDMTLGALADLGVPVEWLQDQLSGLPLDGFEIKSRIVNRHGIQAVKVDVVIEETHHHRHYRDIRDLIHNSGLPATVKNNSLSIFDRIAVAEAAVHGIAKEEVHFHEVGALDAIADVVGTCLGLDYLKIDQIIASPLPLGSGFVQCQHGTLPVPAPATLEIVKDLPVYAGQIQQEMTTPTGAGIAAALASSFESLPVIEIDRIGYGAGTRDLEKQPNLLRVICGKPVEPSLGTDLKKLVMVESNIDDMNPELFGYLMDKLFEDGALDVFWVPVYMKKNRPGTMVQVLCDPGKSQQVVQRILSETTTLGVRFHDVHRACLKREIIDIDTRWGKVKAKKVIGINGSTRIVPEFESCKQVAETQGIALRSVYEDVIINTEK